MLFTQNYALIALISWLAGSENNSLYVYSKKVSDPMLSYRFNVSQSILVSHVGLPRLIHPHVHMTGEWHHIYTHTYTTHKHTHTTHPHIHPHPPHVLTHTHTHHMCSHTHTHTHTHTQPDNSSNSAESQQPKQTEFVSSVCRKKVSKCSSLLIQPSSKSLPVEHVCIPWSLCDRLSGTIPCSYWACYSPTYLYSAWVFTPCGKSGQRHHIVVLSILPGYKACSRSQ